MKTRLDQLTIAEFVELMCEDTSVLLEPNENAEPKELTKVIRDILFEYKQISDPAGVGAYISQSEKYVKAKMSIMLFTMCANLIAMKRHSMVNEILGEYLPAFRKMSAKRLENEVKSRLAKAKKEVEEKEQEVKQGEIDIRRQFDEQTAALMAYFKFQIDTSTMKATIYAHLVYRYGAEMKAKIAALKKH